jgi:hypothetical protein
VPTAAGVRVAGPTGQHGLAAQAAGVDRAGRGRGEGGEHARMRGDRVGDALAVGQPGADELPGVALVDGRAARADRFTAVAARNMQHAARLSSGVIDRCGLAGCQVDSVDAACAPVLPVPTHALNTSQNSCNRTGPYRKRKSSLTSSAMQAIKMRAYAEAAPLPIGSKPQVK